MLIPLTHFNGNANFDNFIYCQRVYLHSYSEDEKKMICNIITNVSKIFT